MSIETIKTLEFTNPRQEVVLEDYPSGRHRVKAKFVIEENPSKGARVSRQTTNPKTGQYCKPKLTTYGGKASKGVLVDGSDGKTYAIIGLTDYAQILVYDGTLKYYTTIHDTEDPDLFLKLSKIIGQEKIAEVWLKRPKR